MNTLQVVTYILQAPDYVDAPTLLRMASDIVTTMPRLSLAVKQLPAVSGANDGYVIVRSNTQQTTTTFLPCQFTDLVGPQVQLIDLLVNIMWDRTRGSSNTPAS